MEIPFGLRKYGSHCKRMCEETLQYEYGRGVVRPPTEAPASADNLCNDLGRHVGVNSGRSHSSWMELQVGGRTAPPTKVLPVDSGGMSVAVNATPFLRCYTLASEPRIYEVIHKL